MRVTYVDGGGTSETLIDGSDRQRATYAAELEITGDKTRAVQAMIRGMAEEFTADL